MIYKLYNGEVEVDFNPISHKFTVNNQNIISVTNILGVIGKVDPLIYWAVGLTRDFLLANVEKLAETKDTYEIIGLIQEAAKQHRVKKEKALSVGTEVHKWVERFIKAKKLKDMPVLPSEKANPQVYNGISAFLKWVDQHKVKFLSSERPIYSRKYKYAGIMDAEAKIDGVVSVVDFKTSNGIYDEMGYQLAAYQAAIEEETGRIFKGPRWIVRFGKNDGEFEVQPFEEQKKDFKVFLACLIIKRRELELKKKGK